MIERIKELFWKIVWDRPLFYTSLVLFTVFVIGLLIYAQFG